MSEIVNALIVEYNKNPVNNYEMKDCSISHHEWNFICGDDITIYLKIENNKVIEFSFDWNPGPVSMASCSLLAEIMPWKTLDEIMTRWYETLANEWLDVLPKRRRAVIIGLLWTRNAIHKRRKDKKPNSDEILIEEFEDILDD